MKVALFKHVEYGCESPDGIRCENIKGYVRTSEYVEVEFPPLANFEVIEAQVAALEEAAAEINAKAFDAVANIKARIMELRSIGHEVQP